MNFDQQMKVFDPVLAKPVNIIGAGSVGSQLIVTLASEGCADLTVWDDDFVASHNIPMSEYRPGDLSRPKLEALAEIVRQKSGVEIKTKLKKYRGELLKTAIVACVDDMDERKLIWMMAKKNPFAEILVDTRLAAEYVEVFAIRPCHPEDIEYYEHFLYSSLDALPPTCGNHGAKHVSGTAANAAVGCLTTWWKSNTVKRHLKVLCGYFQEIP